MAFTPEYRAEVEEKLSLVAPIQTKAMFGGVGIYSEGLFFALLAEDKVYLKVSDLNRGDFEAAGMSAFYPYDSPTPMHYWELPHGLLDRPEELKVWVEKALAVAEQARSKKSRRSGTKT
jgi:DNA transformation protein and related proteins